MDLEQRVKTLEYELKIMKNQVQKTLLEIQEQVLIHYYPSLRSDESVPAKNLVEVVESIRAKQATTEELPKKLIDTTENIREKQAIPETPNVPVVKKVSLDEIRTTQITGAAAPAAAAPASPASPQATDSVNIVKVMEWTNNAAAKLGDERVSKLIEISNQKGIIPIDMKNVMLQTVSLNKVAAPERVAVNKMLEEYLKLDGLLGRAANVEEALGMIEEAQLG